MDTQADEYFQAQAHFYKHVLNYIGSMSLKFAIQLGIPDIIHSHGKPITLSELALALQIDEAKASCMYRLMRVLVHSGFFAKVDKDGGESEGEAYTLTAFSRILVKDKINCLSPFAMAMLHPVLMTPWQFLGDWIQGNKQQRPFESVHGKPIIEYMEHDDPEFKTIMHDALETDSQMMNLVVKDCKPVFEGLGSLVDVGGGTGKLARVISEAYPHMSCTVLDLPYVVDNLPSTENLKFVGGDLFQHIPSADAILIKQVVHMFEDEDCIKVLKKCREAISTQSTKGKVIIIDVVINEKEDKHEVTEAKLFFDLLMMVEASGKERSEKEWEKLLLAAGFSHYKITPLFGLKSIIEAYP